MTPTKVNCKDCANFIKAVFCEDEPFFPKVKVNAKCKIGKRIIFRVTGSPSQCSRIGYFRYCDEFKKPEA